MTMAEPDSQGPDAGSRERTVGEIMIAGFLGVGVALLCLVLPIVHFVTGPLAPGIGGFLAGTRIKVSGGESWVIGGEIGLGLALIAGGATYVISGITGGGRPLLDVSALVGGVILVYATLLGTLGAFLGARFRHQTS
jgi:hypothetical protein